MAVQFNVKTTLTTSNTTFANTVSLTGTKETTKRYEVATGQTDQEHALAIDVSEVKTFIIVSDVNVTFETNSGTTPTNTISLVANKPYVYQSDGYATFLLTGDVTNVYFTNSSGSVATIQTYILE